jgi:hypothetical protein
MRQAQQKNLLDALTLRYNERKAREEDKGANLSAFLEFMRDRGKYNGTRNQIQFAIDSGIIAPLSAS